MSTRMITVFSSAFEEGVEELKFCLFAILNQYLFKLHNLFMIYCNFFAVCKLLQAFRQLRVFITAYQLQGCLWSHRNILQSLKI